MIGDIESTAAEPRCRLPCQRLPEFACDVGAKKKYDLLVQFPRKVVVGVFLEEQKVVVWQHSLVRYLFRPSATCDTTSVGSAERV